MDLIIKLFGTMCLWNGLMKIVQKSSLINKLSNMISPLMKFLFPKMNKEDKEYKEITINIIAIPITVKISFLGGREFNIFIALQVHYFAAMG